MEAVVYSHESLGRLLKGAGADVLTVAGGLCVYRVLPILAIADPAGQFAGIAEVEEWDPGRLPGAIGAHLGVLRDGLNEQAPDDAAVELSELYSMSAEMVLRYFESDDVAEWSDWSSTLSLDIHQQLDALIDDAPGESSPKFYPAGSHPDLTPLEALELEDQVRTLALLSARNPESNEAVKEIARNGNLRTREVLASVLNRYG